MSFKFWAEMFPPTHLYLSMFLKSGDDGASKDIIIFHLVNHSLPQHFILGHIAQFRISSFGLADGVGSAF